jgi:hypothetical protein
VPICLTGFLISLDSIYEQNICSKGRRRTPGDDT